MLTVYIYIKMSKVSLGTLNEICFHLEVVFIDEYLTESCTDEMEA